MINMHNFPQDPCYIKRSPNNDIIIRTHGITVNILKYLGT